MYSGSDSTESANYAQWPLNPTFFQNMPNEQVDWAALAQQWIQMKEAGPPIPEPKITETKKEKNGSGKDITLPSNSNEGLNASWNNEQSPCESFDNSWNWKAQTNWDWNNSWNPQLSTPIVTPAPKTTLLPTPKSSSMDVSNDNASLNSGYTTSRSNEFSTGYNAHPVNHSRHFKPHNRRYSKVNVPKAAIISQAPPANPPSTSELDTSSLDANKRKQLPAWIREGLEKMERDKQRQIEKEKEKEKQNIYTEKIKEQEKKTMEILKDTIKERRRSKFDSDEEQSPKRTDTPILKPTPLSHDQLMLLVRRTMTEILLKVTNEAIHSICTEERQRFIKKIQTSSRESGKALVSEKLGLSMYGSDSGSETEDSETSQKNSDDELKSAIRKRKADFVITEKGIEDKLFQAGQQKGNSRMNHDDDDEENSSENQREESCSETKRTEDTNSKNKLTNAKKHQISPQSSDDSDRASSRRKSSSRSRDSSVIQKRRKRSRTKERGYTPEKRTRRKSPKKSRSRSYERRHSYDYKSKKDKSRSERSRKSRSRSRNSRRSRSRSSSYRSRRSSETSSRSRRKRSRSRNYSKSSRRSRSRSHNKSRTR